MSAAVMRSAAVFSASVSTFFMLMVVVIAFDVGIIAKITFHKSLNRFVAISADTAKELDTCIGKRHLCATADTAADQYICAERHQNRCECAVSLTVGGGDDAVCDDTVLHGIYLKLLGVTEVLKNLSVFMCYRNFHNSFSPLFVNSDFLYFT